MIDTAQSDEEQGLGLELGSASRESFAAKSDPMVMQRLPCVGELSRQKTLGTP